MGDKLLSCFSTALNLTYIPSTTYISNLTVYDFVNAINKSAFHYDDDKKLQCNIPLIVLIKIMLVLLFLRNSCLVSYSLNILK